MENSQSVKFDLRVNNPIKIQYFKKNEGKNRGEISIPAVKISTKRYRVLTKTVHPYRFKNLLLPHDTIRYRKRAPPH